MLSLLSAMFCGKPDPKRDVFRLGRDRKQDCDDRYRDLIND